jgi:hypothetical protein
MRTPFQASGNLVSHLVNNNSRDVAANTSSATMLGASTSFPHHLSVIVKMPMSSLRRASIHGAR